MIRKDMDLRIMIRKKLYITLLVVMMFFGSTNLDILAAYPENAGIITHDTQMYTAADKDATCIGPIKKGSRVDIISVLSCYVLINHNNQYAYVPGSAVCFDANYSRLGNQLPYVSPYKILITEGNLYEKAADTLIQAYFAVPEKIRSVFEHNGFLIKMTEWDITEEAYAPYGGYNGASIIKAALDYEKKKLYINDEFPNTVIHEMGHFVNDYLHMYSSRPENKQLFYSEANKISYYAETNDREFFAEAFRLYIAEPQLLKLMSPNTYVMVDTAVKLFS